VSQSGTKANNEDEKTDAEKSNTDEENKSKLIESSVEKAIEQYRKIREMSDVELTEKELAQIDAECEIIKNREIITQDTEHKPVEILSDDGKIITGPPTLTRFEKARIMGARALQLSLGAPVFIEIPKMPQRPLKLQWKN